MKRPSLKKLILLAWVALALAPGTWVRSPRPAAVLDAGLVATRVPVDQSRIGALEVRAVWKLSSRHSLFGGYSGLVALPGGDLLSGSDKGAALRITLADGAPVAGRMTPFGGQDPLDDKISIDLEALTIDPASGRVWAAYEYLNTIVRYADEVSAGDAAEPEALEDWPANKGPESLVRLPDGRFIVLAEGSEAWDEENRNGLLFEGDPVDGAKATAFDFRGPAGFRPTDMAALPDGRVLILMRTYTFSLPPTFLARLVVADPADISEDGVWRGTEIARFQPPLPTDNFEGLAVMGDSFPVTLWMISDDNTAKFQNTLLMELAWDGLLPEE
ncbi:esterase-like activity of phytase family protein [Qipengyuania sp. DSG2-2]|uniref:esterase-like activity of phytase family protein n=1 Tax=Qipengyuania sp. DGS2-2 TaxID=3349631 RepID=UPI0036D383D4